jgi:uncharacterized protein
MVTASVPGISREDLEAFCRRWKVARLHLFGSGARGELREDSDLDFMVEFEQDDGWDLLDLARMHSELQAISGRPVDFVEKGAIVNPYVRQTIERDARIVYSA